MPRGETIVLWITARLPSQMRILYIRLKGLNVMDTYRIRHIICGILFLSGIQAQLWSFWGISTYTCRSQGVDAARDLINWIAFSESGFENDASSYIAVIPTYLRSFGAQEITQYLFKSTPLTFSGSRVVNRGQSDILADYFGLPSDFQSSVCFSPRISNIEIDSLGYICLDSSECDGYRNELYFYTQAPMVYTNWNLELNETVAAAGTNFFPAAYMGKGTNRINRDQLAPNVCTAFKGTTTFGDMILPLSYGKINGARKDTLLGDIRCALGWQRVWECNRVAGIELFFGTPTGTNRTAEYLFEPQIGNDHHWEIGFGLNVYRQLSSDYSGDFVWGIAANMRLSHLFANKQKRSFDFTSAGRGSRYMLLEVMGPAVDNIVQIPPGQPLNIQYQGLLVPAINVTTLNAKITVGLQAEFCLAIHAATDCWDIDIGYNLWARTQEKISCRDKFPDSRYALKGDASLYGFASTQNAYYGLNATQSMATLYGGQGNGNTNYANLNADSPAEAAAAGGGFLAQLLEDDSIALDIPVVPAGGSNPPILLSDSDIDECSALSPSALSNKLFFQTTRLFDVRSCMQGHLGFGADIEFASKSNGFAATVQQWGVWLVAGLSY